MHRQIVNIVNFIRAQEPRSPVDLQEPVRQQLRLLEKHRLKGTFLLQADALLEPAFTSLLLEARGESVECGLWLEIVEPLARRAGIPWTGRWSWDWHAHCGFTVGYTPPERERLIDAAMELFSEVFGGYPRSVGSWALDAHSIDYMQRRYGIDAVCICKEQWGTDGYTLWGGYTGQGYYPSRNNALCPAQSPETQIPVPVLRMLGSDPIRQYDAGLCLEEGASAVQPVITLEPISPGGGSPAWVDWYFRENFSGNCLSFGYAQAGQENSFGWPAMERGLVYQHARLEELQREGRLTVETLGETGRWYKRAYASTPASVTAALSDLDGGGKRSIWYNSKYYRINIYAEDNRFWIRDLYLFREAYPERYLEAAAEGDALQFDNLPLMDGNRFSGHGIRAGWYPLLDGKPAVFRELAYREEEGAAVIRLRCEPGEVVFRLTEKAVEITAQPACGLIFEPAVDPLSPHLTPVLARSGDAIRLSYHGFAYEVPRPAVGTVDENGRLLTNQGRLVWPM